MDSVPILYPSDWRDYELIDSGESAKLEQFGGYTISRPDPRAIWKRLAPQNIWDNADATFLRTDKEHGEWKVANPPPDPWLVRYDNLVFVLKPTSFKHVGVFPEQAPNWRWIKEHIQGKPLKVLNLFAYTGGATLAAAAAGAHVTHVDSSKPAIDWANENVRASNLTAQPIRWILEDVGKFITREARRGSTYDAIIMDPPRFGRGTKGEVWKLEEDLPKLLALCRAILSPRPIFFLINAYTADLSAVALNNVLTDLFRDLGGSVQAGELALQENTGGRLLPNGIFARWSAP